MVKLTPIFGFSAYYGSSVLNDTGRIGGIYPVIFKYLSRISPVNTAASDPGRLKTVKADVAELVLLDKEKKLKSVENVIVVGHYAGEDEYPVANLNKYELRQVMAVVYFNDIPGLSLEHCQLNDELVYELGLCVREYGPVSQSRVSSTTVIIAPGFFAASLASAAMYNNWAYHRHPHHHRH